MRDAFIHLLQLAYFMLPAYCANMAPPFVRFWRGWNRPISRRFLGDHKTVVGFVAGIAAGMLATAAQYAINIPSPFIDYQHWLGLGLLFGIGAMTGDAIKSLVKRQLKIPPGARWMPFDQLDFVIGAIVLVWPWARLHFLDVIVLFGLSFAADIVVNLLAFRCGIKDTPW